MMLKQRSYARDNEESEFIPTSLMTKKEKHKKERHTDNFLELPTRRSMTRKEKQTKTQHAQVSWNFQQGDLNFTIGGGGVEQPIYTSVPVSSE